MIIQYPISMELDMGVSLLIISKTIYKNLPSVPKLESASVNLTKHTVESIKVLGSLSIKACHSGQEKCLPLLVVSGEGPSLWVETSYTNLNWMDISFLPAVRDRVRKHSC